LLDQLPSAQAEVIRLRLYGELPLQEVAATVGCPLPTVKSRLRLGLQKLRSAIDRQGVQNDL
jgi:RNA polymerase sigma-70 factor (ECF subfamily)